MIELIDKAHRKRDTFGIVDEHDRRTIERWSYAIEEADIGCGESHAFRYVRVTIHSDASTSERCCELLERFGSRILQIQLEQDVAYSSRYRITMVVAHVVAGVIGIQLLKWPICSIDHAHVVRRPSVAFGLPKEQPIVEATAKVALHRANKFKRTSVKRRRADNHERSRMRIAAPVASLRD